MSEFEGKHIVKGNIAAAYAARAARVQVVTAFPITPQTIVVEKISEMVDSDKMNCEFVRMESEHSVMAALVGASIAGARTYTATSGQGLLYMAEPVHWAAGTRLPMVMSIASRGIAPPWNIWADFSDIMALNTSGWLMQIYCSQQEIYDSTMMAFKITENSDVMLPLMGAYGGFILSHTSKPIDMPSQKMVDEFLPKIPEKGWEHIFMDPDRPMMHGNLIMPNVNPGYQEFRMKIQLAQLKALEIIPKVTAEFKEKFGRDYGNGLVQEYKCSDAEYILINYGVLAKQMELAVDELRDDGYKVGMLRLRTYRPFPGNKIIDSVKNAKIIGVVDRSLSFGSQTGGPVSLEVRAALQNDSRTNKMTVVPFINGIGGRDVLLEQQKGQFKILFETLEKGEIPKNGDLMGGTYWTGADKGGN
ncbi:MAG: pyruvate ferredoxin oxidoreductase [archaeon]|nr:pyruvate ferredoxin oxidoreductase [archaeon]